MSDNPNVAVLRERLEQTARDLGEHRQTHVVWRDWLNANPANAAINPHAGSAEFHAGVILDYDRHLANIRAAIAALEAQASAPGGEVAEIEVEAGMDGAWNYTKAQSDYAGNPDEDWRDCDEPEAVEELRAIVKAVLTAALAARTGKGEANV